MTTMLSPSQEWVLRFLVDRGRPTSAQRVGEAMLRRPGFDLTGKTYSPFTLGRMGGGVLAHLAAKGLVRTRKIRGRTVAVATSPGRYQGHPENEPAFFDELFAPD